MDEIRTGGGLVNEGEVGTQGGDVVGRDRRTLNRVEGGVNILLEGEWRRAGREESARQEAAVSFDAYQEAKELHEAIMEMRIEVMSLKNWLWGLTMAVVLQVVLIVVLAVLGAGQVEYLQRSIQQARTFNYSVPDASAQGAGVDGETPVGQK